MFSSSIKSRPAILIWGLTLCCSVVLVMLAYNVYPVPDGDSIWNLPTIKGYAVSGILQNKIVLSPSTIDPSGLERYLAYPPGMALFFGSLMSFLGKKDYQSILVLLALTRCASAFIFAKVLIISFSRRSQPASSRLLLIASLLVVSNAFFLFASDGRYEILSILIISFSLLAALSIKSPTMRHIAIQICLGLLFPVSIANGLIGACLYCIYLAFDITSMSRRFLLFSSMVVISVFIFAASYYLANIPFLDGINGLKLHARAAITEYKIKLSFAQSLNYYKSWILFGFMAVIQFLLYVLRFYRNPFNTLADRLFLTLSVIAWIFFAYYFGGRYASNHYTLYAFLPIYQILGFKLILSPPSFGQFPLNLCSLALLVASILSLLYPFQQILLFPYYLTSGSTYFSAKTYFEKIDTGNCHIVYNPGLVLLDEKISGSTLVLNDSYRVVSTERMKNEIYKEACVVVFVQEVNGYSRDPSGMQLIADFSDRSKYTRLLQSLRLIRNPKGFSFRAYKGELSTQ